MLRGNGVGFKASKVHFSSTSVGFVLFTEAPKSEDEQGTHPFYRTRGLYQLLHLTNPVRIQRTIWLDEDDLVFVHQVLFHRQVLFDRQISRLVNFRRFYPYPYWIEEFWPRD